jgi:hypothetical protein
MNIFPSTLPLNFRFPVKTTSKKINQRDEPPVTFYMNKLSICSFLKNDVNGNISLGFSKSVSNSSTLPYPM